MAMRQLANLRDYHSRLYYVTSFLMILSALSRRPRKTGDLPGTAESLSWIQRP